MTVCDSCKRHQWTDVNVAFYLFALLVSGFAVAKLFEALHFKAAGLIPDGVIGMFHYPSGRTMALGLTQPLTEMSKSKR
jgi:hypothetical protein